MSKCACRVREWFAEVVLNLQFQSQVARKYVRRKEQHKQKQRIINMPSRETSLVV